ncbi:MAG: hypothetical protein IT332_10860 [Ardenticatenales bacterium]|nr:hypothetical protein [Ardenticatenales bacterium]
MFTTLNRVNVGLGVTAILLLAIGVVVDKMARTRGVGQSAAAVRGRLMDWTPVAVELGLGTTLLAMAATGTAWGRELSVPPAVQAAEAVLGTMLVVGLGVGPAAWGVIGLFGLSFAWFPATDLVDYLIYIPLALFVIVRGRPRWHLEHWLARRMGRSAWTDGWLRPRWLTGSQSIAMIRIALGLSLIYYGLNEKWIHPELAMGVVDNHADVIFEPVRTVLGSWVTRELYVFGAGLVEIGVGVALTLGVLVGPLAVVLTLLFATTATIFGSELLGHLALYGIVVAFLVEGAGSAALPARLVAGSGHGQSPLPS